MLNKHISSLVEHYEVSSCWSIVCSFFLNNVFLLLNRRAFLLIGRNNISLCWTQGHIFCPDGKHVFFFNKETCILLKRRQFILSSTNQCLRVEPVSYKFPNLSSFLHFQLSYTIRTLSTHFCTHVIYLLHMFRTLVFKLHSPKQCLHSRGSYLPSIVIPLHSRNFVGRQPRCLSVGA